MAVSMAYLQTLSEAIETVSGAAQNAALAILTKLVKEGDYETPLDLVEDALRELEPLFQSVAENCASLSAASYDILRLAATGEALGATPYPDRDPEWTRKALYGIAKDHGDVDAFVQAILARMDYEAKRAAGSTMFSNGADDPGNPRFARIPLDRDCCPFCSMLAARGFVYYSEKTAGKLDHYHAGCRCRVTPQWGGESYEGYDPDEWYERYEQLLDEGKLDPDALARSARRAKQRHSGRR